MSRMEKVDKLREELNELHSEFIKLDKEYHGEGLTNKDMQRMNELEVDMGLIREELERLSNI